MPPEKTTNPLTNRLGTYRTTTVTAGETVKTYIPPCLPPSPELNLQPLQALIEKASLLLGKLNAITSQVPNVNLFLYHYIRQEALLSSQIEGTQSSYHDLMLHEVNEAISVPFEDVEEVSTYIKAIQYGVHRLKQEDFPLSLRLLRDVHAVLLTNTRGRNKQPGQFRQSQNWIGGTLPSNALFVPPPPEWLPEGLGALEAFMHETESNLPHLIKVALLHVQFEIIHPFLDGNGRLGRLLITLYLLEKDVLTEPILYISLYLKRNQADYYRLLNEVRLSGNWEAWLEFFLNGVIETCKSGVIQAQAMGSLISSDKEKIEIQGRAKRNLIKVFEFLLKKPILSIPYASEQLAISQPTITKVFQILEELEIVQEISGKQRGKLYKYSAYSAILEKPLVFEQSLEEWVSPYIQEKVYDWVEQGLGAMSETNAIFDGDFTIQEMEINFPSFEMQVRLHGEHLQDKAYCGDDIDVRIQGEFKFDIQAEQWIIDEDSLGEPHAQVHYPYEPYD
jgi:Fic family protein